MLVLASIGWALMSPLRDAVSALASEQRSIISSIADGQRARAKRVKARYRNWALVTTAIFAASAVAILPILIEIKPGKDFVWQKAVLFLVWLGYGVAATRLWKGWKDIDVVL